MGAPRLNEAGIDAADGRPAPLPHLSVGITTANWLDLGSELAKLEEAGADFVHFDAMDGCFCPQLTYGPAVIAALRTTLRKDVHLMIEEPIDKLAGYVDAGADVVTVHIESTRHPHRALQALGSMQTKRGQAVVRGVALNPGTPVDAVEPLVADAELILVLAVNPGWGGQKFHPGTESRIAAAQAIVRRSDRNVMVGVDGGITRENIGGIAAAGVDLIVAGSAVFNGGDAAANLRNLRTAAREGRGR